MNELVFVFAREQVALHLRAKLFLHAFHRADDLSYSLLRGLEGSYLLLVGAAAGKLGRSLFQFVHTAHLHRVKLGGTWVFLVATDPVVQVNPLLDLNRFRGRGILRSGSRLDHLMVDGDHFGDMIFIEVNKMLARVLLEPIIKAAHELVVFTAGVSTRELLVVLEQPRDLVLLLQLDVLLALLDELF